jgi:site-specific DNA-methyltransferase (adenine-specific)
MGRYHLHNGDCLEFMKSMQDKSIDAVITDPPYTEATKKGARTRNDGVFGGDHAVPFSITAEDLMARFDEAGRICSRWFVASVDWRHGVLLESKPPQSTKFVRAGVWVKTNSAPQFTGDRPAPGWEFVAIMHSDSGKMRWNGGGGRAVWQTSIESNNGHPTPKPLQLIKQWIADFTDPGDTVIDPFMGSGTTGVACMGLDRNFIGCEIDKKYFDIAERRISQAAKQEVMFA